MRLLKEARWVVGQLRERLDLLRGNLTVLMYHRVCEPGDHAFLQECGVPSVSPATFREQLVFLLERGFRVLSFREALEGLEARRPFAPRSCILTFDDGWRDNHAAALPVLRELDLPATLFVASRILDGEELLFEHRVLWGLRKLPPADFAALCAGLGPLEARAPGVWIVLDPRGPDLATRRRLGERLAEAMARAGVDEAALARELYLTSAELRELRDAGVEIASHGAEHHPLTVLSGEERARDLDEARERLGDVVGDDLLPVYCSPYGSHTEADRELLRQRGYRAAASVRFGTNNHRVDPYFLRRVSLGDQSWNRLRFLDRAAKLAAKLDG